MTRPVASSRRPNGAAGPAAPSAAGAPRIRRCAVYTRKSSEEGLEQEYNSLHAQREACEAYVASQQHEGWRLVSTAYDDGGISGGTMDRPALQRLLADVAAGKVDVIVVYKVDRLTRSLADFAKMVELFDRTGASFVAVTQQFNTTTSMGRLTLNVLLSFAQFEREVTGERIRDKIAASKRKGMWMGGTVPLGYAVQDRKLVVVPEDAATVLHIYNRYLALGTVRALKAELDRDGITSRPPTARRGIDLENQSEPLSGQMAQDEQGQIIVPASNLSGASRRGGSLFSRGALYLLLGNPVYRGLIRHKDQVHPGQHEAIVPTDLFDAVQAQLSSGNNGERGRGRALVAGSPLAGKLFDADGQRLVPTHAKKGERRYRYYVSASLILPGTERPSATVSIIDSSEAADENSDHRLQDLDQPGWRLPAREVEQAIEQTVGELLGDRPRLAAALRGGGVDADQLASALSGLARWQARRRSRDRILAELVRRVVLSPTQLQLHLAIPGANGTVEQEDSREQRHPTFEHRVAHRLRRRGNEMRLVIGAAVPARRDDPAMLKMVARAHAWFGELASGRAGSIRDLAERLGLQRSYVQRLLPLALLAPALVEQVVAGEQPAGLTAEWLQRNAALPTRWSEQVDLLSA